jgi:hypothetical protein
MYRNVRLERLLRQSQQLDMQSIQGAISVHFSHPHSICAHVDEEEAETTQLETRTAVLISLTNRTMFITDGPPCRTKFVRSALAA